MQRAPSEKEKNDKLGLKKCKYSIYQKATLKKQEGKPSGRRQIQSI